MSDFPSFDTLLDMAQHRPDELERFRQEQIERLISSAPEISQRRLRGLQFQIDAQRQLHSDSALGSCMKISQMMHESFANLRRQLNDITGTHDPLRVELQDYDDNQDIDNAKVIRFPLSQ